MVSTGWIRSWRSLGESGGTVIRVGYRPGLSRDEAVDLCVKALWVAADADSATGGPDPLRGVYPVVATITVAGFERVGDDELGAGVRRVPERCTIASGLQLLRFEVGDVHDPAAPAAPPP